MKIIRIILFSILGFLLLGVLISLFIPREVYVERSVTVNAPRRKVFTQVNDLKNWTKWSPWHQLDPDMSITYSDTTSGTGAYYSWSSEHPRVGKGKLTLRESKPEEYIVTEMDFMEQGKAEGKFVFEEVNGGTKVTWNMNTDMGMHPLKKYLGLMMDDIIRDYFEKGLNNLKRISEEE